MADQVRGLLSPWLRRSRVDKVRRYLTGRVLDFGCGGAGVLTAHVPADRYLGVEVIQRNYDRVRRNHPTHRFLPSLPGGETFDTIVSLAVIEHVQDPATLLQELAALLEPDGRLVLTTPHAAFDWAHTLGARLGLFDATAEEEHQPLFDRERMRGIAEPAGLKIVGYERFLFGANQLFVMRRHTMREAGR